MKAYVTLKSKTGCVVYKNKVDVNLIGKLLKMGFQYHAVIKTKKTKFKVL